MPDEPPSFKHSADRHFWICYHQLPAEIQTLALKNYRLLKSNPRHPSLQFKKMGKVWSVRVGIDYRALATQLDDGYLWFWIGAHHEYDKIIRG